MKKYLTDKLRKRLIKYYEFLEQPDQFYQTIVENNNDLDFNKIEDIIHENRLAIGITLERGWYNDGKEIQKRLNFMEEYYTIWIKKNKSI